MPVSGEEAPGSWRNIVKNYNEYSDDQWEWITQHYPRKMWGIKVVTVSPSADTTVKKKGRFYRLLSWWSMPGKWLP